MVCQVQEVSCPLSILKGIMVQDKICTVVQHFLNFLKNWPGNGAQDPEHREGRLELEAVSGALPAHSY